MSKRRCFLNNLWRWVQRYIQNNACIVSKQSHGAVEKKCCLHVFSKKNEKEGGRENRFLFEVCKHEEWDVILVSVTQACSVLLWCYVTMKMKIVAESVGCLEGFRTLERTPTREVTSDGVLFPQSDSPICRVVWYKNKNNTENRSII